MTVVERGRTAHNCRSGSVPEARTAAAGYTVPEPRLPLMSQLQRYIRNVPDFPSPGILFRDIAPLLREHFAEAIEAMSGLLSSEQWRQIDAVAGIESRGFILGA